MNKDIASATFSATVDKIILDNQTKTGVPYLYCNVISQTGKHPVRITAVAFGKTVSAIKPYLKHGNRLMFNTGIGMGINAQIYQEFHKKFPQVLFLVNSFTVIYNGQRQGETSNSSVQPNSKASAASQSSEPSSVASSASSSSQQNPQRTTTSTTPNKNISGQSNSVQSSQSSMPSSSANPTPKTPSSSSAPSSVSSSSSSASQTPNGAKPPKQPFASDSGLNLSGSDDLPF